MWKTVGCFAFLGLVFGPLGQAMAGPRVAEKLLVDLRAQELPYGAITKWSNHATLGDFVAHGRFVVEDVAGRKAVTFDGQSHFEGPASVPGIEGKGTRSIEVWAFNPSIGAKECMVAWSRRNGPDASNVAFTYGNRTDCGAFGHWNSTYDMAWTGKHAPAPAAGVWWYLVYTYDGTTARIYVNGEEEVAKAVPCATHAGFPIRLGTQANNTGDGPEGASYYSGSIAVVRIHDGVLSPEDIAYNATATSTQELATGPSPADGATDVGPNVVLHWIPGGSAVKHNVYFGAVLEDVNTASLTGPLGVLVGQGQTTDTYTPAALEFGRTYYWRVDEVNAPPDGTIFKGDVWSFTVEPVSYPLAGAHIRASASSSSGPAMGPEKTVDGSGLNARDEHSTLDTDMWLSALDGPQPAWIQYDFDKPYKLHQMLVWNSNQSLEPAVGLGAKSVTVQYTTESGSRVLQGALIVAETLLVDLRAQDLPYGGAMTSWPNHGTLGDFVGKGTFLVEDTSSRKAVTFNGNSYFEGPASVAGIEGNGTRSIEVWAFNPAVGARECMVSWSHRNGPTGSNMAFMYGTLSTGGAVGHWGGADMAWAGAHAPAPAAGVWWYLAYTYDGTTARVYVNGKENVTKDFQLVTHPNCPIRIGHQADNTGAGVAASDYLFSGAIAEVRIHDGVLSPSDIAHNFALPPQGLSTDKPAANGLNWTSLGEFQFARASGKAGYAANTLVDLGGIEATHLRLLVNSAWGDMLKQCGLSEVRFFYIPVLAREPQPVSGQTAVPPDVVLSWRTGREAASHDVYLGTDANNLTAAGTASVASFDTVPLDLQLAKTYYWKINEVNEAGTPKVWEGEIWNFSTPESLVVDDFESYTDNDGEAIWQTWSDGLENPANGGSQVGNDPPPYAEGTIVHAGKQSMPLFYNNTKASLSEAVRTLTPAQNWTRHGITTLVLFFHGTLGNTGQLYLKINDTKIAYSGDPQALSRPRWAQWNIALASAGVSNLKKITKLAVGVEGGSSGTLYLDDLLLYGAAPVVPEEIWLQAEATATLTAPLKVYADDPAAMGGKYIGTEDAIGNSTTNPPAPNGTASYKFTVKGGVYKISGRVLIPNDESFWVRIAGATTQTRNHSSGWISWTDPPQGRDWHWADVFSADDGNAVVRFTLPAGTHTLEIAYREDGAWIDAIVIESVP